jgi:hypothetical protein
VCGVAKGVEDGADLVRQIVGKLVGIVLGNNQVLGESAGAVDADTLGVAAQMLAAGAAVAAVPADDMPLTRDAVARGSPANSWPMVMGTGMVALDQSSQL